MSFAWGIEKNETEWWQSLYIPGTIQAPLNGRLDPLALVFHYCLPALPNDQVKIDSYCKQSKIVNVVDEWLSPHVDNVSACELIDSLVCLALLSLGLSLAYFALRYVCALAIGPFSTLSYSRQMYVVNNVSKSVMLGMISVSIHWWTWSYKIFVEHNYHPIGAPLMSFHLKRAVAWYCVSDLVSLVFVPRLPMTTVLHHLLSVGFSVVVFAIEARPEDVISMMGLYGSWSAFAYGVNSFLGMRVVFPKSGLVDAFAIFSLLLYIACCLANWSWHAYWFVMLIANNRVSILACIYALGMIFIARDDLILMRWLWRRANLGISALLHKVNNVRANEDSPGWGCKAPAN